MEERLGGKIPFGPLFNAEDIISHEHFERRDMLVEVEQPGSAKKLKIAGSPIKMTKTPGGVHNRAPKLGEHTSEVLLAAGVSQSDIDRLKAAQENATKP